MEPKGTQTFTAKTNACSFANLEDDGSLERLNSLLAVNAEILREKSLYRTHREELEASLMKHPISVKSAFAYFGLMLGTFPPASIFFKLLNRGSDEFGLLVLFLLVNIICAVVGYFSGKLIGRMVSEMEKYSWSAMLLTVPFIGAFWGMLTGGAGGILIFIIGAFFGAIIAAMVGSIAVPAFAVFHRMLKKGEMIERNQFLPISMGITFIISAFILGL